MWHRVYVAEPQWKLPEYTWGEERELCKRCAHYCERLTGTYRTGNVVTVMSCALNRQRTQGRHHGTCIDMRYDGPCGREGKLFKEKTK